MKYFLIAGEASGDLHGSNLMASLKKEDPQAEFVFFGGDLMLAQGGTMLMHYRKLAYMGFVPVLMNLRTILKNLKTCQQAILKHLPDVVILIDYPGFNLKIAKYVKTHSTIPVHYYISPKVWAWKEYRVKSFKKYVDKMLCILPFEVEFFKKHNYKVDYVGNPTVDAVENFKKKSEGDTLESFIRDNKLSQKPIIALLAGSRKQEIKENLPTMLDVTNEFGKYQTVIAAAPGIDLSYYSQFITNKKCKIVNNQTYRLLKHSHIAVVTSGTATLETALFRVPQVVCYKTFMPNLSFWIFKHLFKIRYISLVNLIANREVVKELFAKYFSAKNIQSEVKSLLNDESYRKKMLANYEYVIKALGKEGASDKAAHIIYNELEINKSL